MWIHFPNISISISQIYYLHQKETLTLNSNANGTIWIFELYNCQVIEMQYNIGWNIIILAYKCLDFHTCKLWANSIRTPPSKYAEWGFMFKTTTTSNYHEPWHTLADSNLTFEEIESFGTQKISHIIYLSWWMD